MKGDYMKKTVTLLLMMIIAFNYAKSQYWKEFENIPAPFNSNYWLDVYFHPSNPNYGWVCGFQGMVVRTSDAGTNWSGSVVMGATHLEHIHFPTLTTGYTSGPEGIFKSTDGGASWSNVTPNLSWNYWGCYFINENVGLVIGGGCVDAQHFYRTEDGGNSWTLFTGNEPASGLTDLILYEVDGLGYAASSGKLWRTDDGGRSWYVFASSGSNVWNEELSISGSSFLLPSSGTECSGQGGGGGARFSTDMGNTWNYIATGAAMFGSYLNSSTSGWACGDSRTVIYTSDGGVSWSLKNCGIKSNDDLDDIWFVDSDLGYVVGSGIYKLAPPEYLISKDSLFFDNVCSGQSKLDSLTLKHLNFTSAPADFRLIDNVGDHFELIYPDRIIQMQGCEEIQLIVKFAPKDDMSHTARIQIIVNAGTDREVVKYVELIGEVKKPSASPQDTLYVFDELVCNTVHNFSIPWFVDDESETIISARKQQFIEGIQLKSGIPFTINPPVTNMNLTIQLPDTGWFEERFIFKIDPCDKDTFITVRAYGVSPIISHKSKDRLNSDCMEIVYDTIQVFNTGNRVLDIPSVKIVPETSNFSIVKWIDDELPVSIDVNDSKWLIIAYSPIETGVHESVLHIENNDSTKLYGYKNPYKIKLQGQSHSPILTDTVRVNLGDVCLGKTKLQSKRLYNHGNADATLSFSVLPANINLTLSDINNRIRALDSVTLNIVYEALELGDFNEELIIEAVPCDKQIVLIITGRVVSNEIEISPELITGIVKTGESLVNTIRIDSKSNIDISIKNIKIEPEPADWDYSYQPSVPMVLLPGQGADFEFTFTPKSASTLKGKIVIETDGFCEETFYIDLDLSSFSRFVEVSPSVQDFGLHKCNADAYSEITISNKGFSADTVNSISLEPASSYFTITNLPELPLIIQPDSSFKLMIHFSSNDEGAYSTMLHVRTIGEDGQNFEIPISGEFRRTDIRLKYTELDFGETELCSDIKTMKFTFTNHGTIEETLELVSDSEFEAFTIDKTMSVIAAGESVEFEISLIPDRFKDYGMNSQQFKFKTTVCEEELFVQASVNVIRPLLVAEPEAIDFGDKWTEESKVRIIKLTNVGETDVTIQSLRFSEPLSFRFINDPSGETINKGEEKSFELEFIASDYGYHSSTILLQYASDCVDSLLVSLEGNVRQELYENLVYTEHYEGTPGEEKDIYIYLQNGLDRVNPERIDFTLKFDHELFYPNQMFVRTAAGFVEQQFSYSQGLIQTLIDGNVAAELLTDSGKIIKFRGLVLASIPDSTPLHIEVFEVVSDKDLIINKSHGSLKLIEYCEEVVRLSKFKFLPWMRINAGTTAENGVYRFSMLTTSEVDVRYKLVDISGNIVSKGTLTPGREYSEFTINLEHHPSGLYFMQLETQYQHEMLNIINIK